MCFMVKSTAFRGTTRTIVALSLLVGTGWGCASDDADTLDATRTELAQAQDDLAVAEETLSDVEAELAATQAQVDAAEQAAEASAEKATQLEDELDAATSTPSAVAARHSLPGTIMHQGGAEIDGLNCRTESLAPGEAAFLYNGSGNLIGATELRSFTEADRTDTPADTQRDPAVQAAIGEAADYMADEAPARDECYLFFEFELGPTEYDVYEVRFDSPTAEGLAFTNDEIDTDFGGLISIERTVN